MIGLPLKINVIPVKTHNTFGNTNDFTFSFKNRTLLNVVFIIGMKIVQGFTCDPVKQEYVATSKRGKEINRRRFSSCEQLINWSMSLPDEKLVTTDEMDKGTYYVKVTVKRKSKRLPLFFDLLFFFLPGEKNMDSLSEPIMLHEEK